MNDIDKNEKVLKCIKIIEEVLSLNKDIPDDIWCACLVSTVHAIFYEHGKNLSVLEKYLLESLKWNDLYSEEEK